MIAEKAPGLGQSFLPFAWDEVAYQGKIFGIPTNTDTRVLYFRPDILESNGIGINEVLNSDRPLTRHSISRPPSPMGATIWKEMMDIQNGIIAGTFNNDGILPRLTAIKETLNKKMHRYCQRSDEK